MAFQKIWSQYIADDVGEEPDAEILTRFVQMHRSVPDRYFQQMEALFRQIDLASVQPGKVAAARQQLLAFNQQAIVLQVETILARLEETIELAFEREAAAAADRAAAEMLSTKIWGVSLGLAIAIASLLAFTTSRAITRPIQAITTVAQRVSRERNFKLQAPTTTEDEIATLARALNQLIQQVNQQQ